MQQNLPRDMMVSHKELSNLEIELAKERNRLIQHCNTKPIYAASYYPVLQHYYSLTDQYKAELSNFRSLLQSVQQPTSTQPAMTNNVITASNEASILVPSSVPDTSSSTAMRKIASNMNGNYASNNADGSNPMDDTKTESVSMPSSTLHSNNVNLTTSTGINTATTMTTNDVNDVNMMSSNMNSNENVISMDNQNQNAMASNNDNNNNMAADNEMKVATSLYSDEQAQRTLPRKPPVKSSSSSAATIAMMNTNMNMNTNTDSHQEPVSHRHGMPSSYASAPSHTRSHAPSSYAQGHGQGQGQARIQVSRPVTKPRSQLKVQRHKYKYEGRGFQIWRQNLQRPIYTATTLRLSRRFGSDDKAVRFTGDDKQVRRFLLEKGGFRPEYIEQITFIPKRDGNGQGAKIKPGQRVPANQIDFIIVRVRASLQYIFQCIDNIEKLYGPEVIKKQNNRSKTNSNLKNCAKLYVNNFDILDENTHRNLTKIFVRYGDLEKDIFVGRDKKQNPYALVQYRDSRDAQRCVNAHSKYESTIYFPPRDNSSTNDDGDSSPSKQRYFNRKLHIEYLPENNDQNSRNKSANRSRRGGRGGRRQ